MGWRADYARAVRLARAGETEKAVVILRKVYKNHSKNIGVRRDYIAILGWAGHDEEATRAFESLPKGRQPDYVLESVAHSYANLHQIDNAVALYRQGAHQSPANVAFAVGEIRALADNGSYDLAMARAQSARQAFGNRTEIISAEEYITREKAIRLARSGNVDEALKILSGLRQQNRQDIGLTQDYAVVSSWAGHDAEAINTYNSLPINDRPDYVLEAVGHAYRHSGRFSEARALYQTGLNRSPGNVIFATGVIRTLAEGGYSENALATADADLLVHGERPDILVAAGDTAAQMGQDGRALRYYERALQADPHHRGAMLGFIRATDRAGFPMRAIKFANENPGLISASEYRGFQGDAAAALVRWGVMAPSASVEATRFVVTDRAIERLNSLIAEWAKIGPDAQSDIHRARLDRIAALDNRYLMNDAIQEYISLRDEGVTIPPFTLSSVADAYLYLHQPETARDLYLQILQSDPKNFFARRQLFYADVECDDYDDAFRTIDTLAAEQAHNGGLRDSDTRSQQTQITAGQGRLFAGMVSEGEKRMIPAIAASPSTPGTHELLGDIASAHGWPRQALSQYQMGAMLAQGPSVGNEIGIAATNLTLQNFSVSEAKTTDLVRRVPEVLGVQRQARDEDVHNMAELRVNAGYDFPPDTSVSVNGGEGYGVGTMIYSSPIDYNWRIFGGDYFTHQTEPNAEGHISLSRATLGVEYRDGPMTISGAPTFNWYDSHHDSKERPGGAAEATYSLNDQWTIAGSGEIFSRETPLRALNSGVTSDFVNMHALWRQDETREIRFGGNLMPFSDGNFRSGLDASYAERVLTTPHLHIEGVADVGESQNSRDENRFYYNPKQDFIALVGAQATQTLYQRYDTLWQHTLRLTPGIYYQENFGTDAALRMHYDQRVRFDKTWDIGLGVNFSRLAYDGQPENDVSLLFDLTKRF